MARIRTVKPELFKHEQLFEAEQRIDQPVRLAWIGLFTVADKEGRFKWRPRAIKTDIFPYDLVTDMSRILDELVTMKMLIRYADETGEEFGQIVNWHKHQRVRADEMKSTLPDSKDCKELGETVTNPLRTRDVEVTNQRRGIGNREYCIGHRA